VLAMRFDTFTLFNIYFPNGKRSEERLKYKMAFYNANASGFLPKERKWLDRVTAGGYVDVFREFNQEPGQYTYWDMMTRARDRNVGWRIDYFLVSQSLRPRVVDAWIDAEVKGSAHCPLGIELDI
jgi:exodeoxyribonuclease-3